MFVDSNCYVTWFYHGYKYIVGVCMYIRDWGTFSYTLPPSFPPPLRLQFVFGSCVEGSHRSKPSVGKSYRAGEGNGPAN